MTEDLREVVAELERLLAEANLKPLRTMPWYAYHTRVCEIGNIGQGGLVAVCDVAPQATADRAHEAKIAALIVAPSSSMLLG